MAWSEQLRRRLKLNDLHAFLIVAETGSMGRAAQHLNTSQPAISRAIAQLEQSFGVSLFDRDRRGVALTKAGRALLDGGVAAFDDLRQAAKSIEFLSDPALGEIRIGGNEAIIAGLLPAVLRRLRRRYPGISIHIVQAGATAQQYRDLRERKVDLIFGRIPARVDDDIAAEVLFEEQLHVVAGLRSPWRRRRKLTLAELIDEPWTLSPQEGLVGAVVAEAFRTNGFAVPRKGLAIGSIHLQSTLVTSGSFLGMFPGSMLQFGEGRAAFSRLPLDLNVAPWPVGVMRLRKRAIGAPADLFLTCAREEVRPVPDTGRRRIAQRPPKN